MEGPTDRIYLRHWLKGADESLVEGVHYSIMFYGGRLLSHLSPDDPDVHDFISLGRINRNLAIIIDSDKSKGASELNVTKSRVISEFESCGGVSWVTAGREIENYIDESAMMTAVKDEYPGYTQLKKFGQFSGLTKVFMRSAGAKTPIDKVKVCHRVCSKPANFDVLDLQQRVLELVALIRRANGL